MVLDGHRHSAQQLLPLRRAAVKRLGQFLQSNELSTLCKEKQIGFVLPLQSLFFFLFPEKGGGIFLLFPFSWSAKLCRFQSFTFAFGMMCAIAFTFSFASKA